MKKITQIVRSVIILMFTVVMFNSCVDKDYDDIVTANVDPDLTATKTIKELQSLATGASPVEITTDEIIVGVVTGDDLSGNIYKKLILQQDSSGIAVQLDVSNFNTEYPTGRRVYVKCKGLYIANNDGNFELGSSSSNPVGRIPAGLVTKYLVKGMWGQYLTPKVYTLDNPNIPTNTLVRFDDVQFDAGYNGVAYAASSPANLDMVDCNGNLLILYSSTYSTFALAKTPYGKGSIAGIYILYNGDGELQIRDTTDVNMPGLRCDGSSGVPSLMPLDSIRLLDPGAGSLVDLPGDKKINVIVISDYSTNMLGGGGRNIYVQDGTAGIQIRFSAAHSFAVGTNLEINVSGMELSTFSGVLQINNVPLGNAIQVGTGSVTPRTATIPDIIANFDLWEGQLVKIEGVTITPNPTYSGVNFLNDLSLNSIELFTSSFATFAGDSVKTGTVSVTGILTEYNGTKEILMRGTSDVQ